MMSLLLVTHFLLVVGAVQQHNFRELAAASSEFSQKLYEEIAVNVSNFIYSPYSIHSALTMTSLGADGETAAELTKVLGLSSFKTGLVHEIYRELTAQYNRIKRVCIKIANGIFTNPNVQIKPQFVSDVAINYDAQATAFDPQSKDGPEKVINDFINNKTKGLIKNVLSKGSITELSSIVLVNTVFFNGTWEKQFQPTLTAKQEFTSLNGVKSTIDFMSDERTIKIKKDVFGADVAEIPFKGGRFAFYIALPKKLEGITELEKSLATSENVKLLLTDVPAVDAKLQIPKFTPILVKLQIPKIKIEISISLKNYLKKAGIVSAFDSSVANFKKISDTANISLSDVIHKALIEIQEAGTVAAAATVVDGPGSAHPPTESFIADHPFLIFLGDKETGQIFFQGRYSGKMLLSEFVCIFC